MLDPQEVKQFQEIVQQTVRNEIAISEHRMIGKIDLAVNDSEQRMVGEINHAVKESEQRMTGEINHAVKESEQRMIGKIDQAVNDSEQRMQLAIKQLGIDIGDFITQSILPQIEDKVSKNEVKKLTAKIQEHDSILKKVKAGFIN